MKKLRLAVLISGTGRSLKNLIGRIKEGSLSAEIAVVVSSNREAKGLQYAEMGGLKIEIIEKLEYQTLETFSAAVFDVCRENTVDLVVMAGYVKFLKIPDDFYGKVLNIHPSLLPAFSGQGFYGDRVHTAVLKKGVKLTGCSVHFVDNDYDNGPILLQKSCEVRDDDTVGSLNDRVFELECAAYPEAIQLIAEDRVRIRNHKVFISR